MRKLNDGYIKKLDELEEKMGYKFKDKKYLINALTHSSYANETDTKSNERLEFLGDSVLEYVSSQYLYDNYSQFNEGELTKLRAQVVCKDSLSQIAREKLSLNKYILLGKSQIAISGFLNKSVLEDATEALIAAVKLDGGLEEAEKFVIFLLKDKVEYESKQLGKKDYKTSLQELLQKKEPNVLIEYNIVSESRPDHKKSFVAELKIDGKRTSRGTGSTKKEAEMMCAKQAILKLGG